MNSKHTVLVLSLIALLGGAAAEARERAQHGGHHAPHSALKRGNFTSDTTHTTGDGRTFTRHTEQTVTDGGFERNSTMTNPEGKTATRSISGSYDKDSKTRTRSVEGTTFSGKTYSHETSTQRTENGYTRESEWTNPAGKSGSRSVMAEVDKEAGTMTKNITITKPNGETAEKTVTKTIQDGPQP